MLAGISKHPLDRAWTDLERLSVEIGARVAGTADERFAAEMLTAAFTQRGLDVIPRSFRWVGWEPIGQPHVEITLGDGSQRQLRTAPMAYTDSTPTGGVAGRLTPAGICELVPGLLAWPRYAVEQGGVPLAFIAVVPAGQARPFPRPERQLLLEPIVIVGSDEFAEIADRYERGETLQATVESQGRYVPGNTSANVIAELPGAMDAGPAGGHPCLPPTAPPTRVIV